MSVYKHDYRAYTGRLTPPWMRIVVLVRYALAEAWSSKITVGLFTLSLLPPIVFLVLVYLANNPLARALVMRANAVGIAMDAAFFLKVLEVQCWFALAVLAWIAPRLVAFDLADNALPIVLSHPVSRFGYVCAKLVALFASLSLVTWVPCLMLFAFQSYSASEGWGFAHLRIAMGLFVGSVVWIAFLSMLGLALSAWVRWRVVATGAIFAAVFVPAGIGAIVTAILRTRWGFLLNLPVAISQVWQRLLGAPDMVHSGRHPYLDRDLPSAAIAATLLLACLLFAAMLHVRIRAREVVRG